MRAESLDFLKAIVNVPSPSGYEERAAEVYRGYTKDFADKLHTDVHGNVWAIANPEAEMKIMLAGHMDEIGFIIHYIDDAGLLYFSGIGGHDSVIPVGQRVWIHGKEQVCGVIGRKAIHLLEDEERKKKPELKDLWIDIGASNRAEAEEVVSLGDVVTFQYEFQHLMGDRATARGFDNKMGTFIVGEALRLLKEEGGLDAGVGVYAVATVQEEIGLRGAKTSAFGIAAQSGLAVDVNHATDYPTVSKTRHGQLDIGKGPSVMRGANSNPIVVKMIDPTRASEARCHRLRRGPSARRFDPRGQRAARRFGDRRRRGLGSGQAQLWLQLRLSASHGVRLHERNHDARPRKPARKLHTGQRRERRTGRRNVGDGGKARV